MSFTGELRLGVQLRDGRSVVTEQSHRGALRVLRAHRFDPWQVCCTAINPGGGYLGGDSYQFDLDVGPGAGLLLTSQSATRIYRTPTAPATQHTAARVGRGALLELLPDQVIVYRDGSYRQSAVIDVDTGGTLVLADIVTPGWAPDGSGFGYRDLTLRTEVRRPDADGVLRPALLDNLRLRPERGDLTGLGWLDGFSHAGSLIVVDDQADADLVDLVHALASKHAAVRVGCSLAPGPALVVRMLANSTAAITELVLDVDAVVRSRWFDLPRVDLRKP